MNVTGADCSLSEQYTISLYTAIACQCNYHICNVQCSDRKNLHFFIVPRLSVLFHWTTIRSLICTELMWLIKIKCTYFYLSYALTTFVWLAKREKNVDENKFGIITSMCTKRLCFHNTTQYIRICRLFSPNNNIFCLF